MSNEDWNELDESYRSALSGALETAHPAVEQAGEDERVIGWRERILAAHPNSDPGFWPDALLVEHMAAEIADLRAALAQPSQAPDYFAHADKKLEALLNATALILESPGHDAAHYWAKCLREYDEAHAQVAQARHVPELAPLNLAPHAEAFNEAPAEALKSEQAEAERPEVVGSAWRNIYNNGFDHVAPFPPAPGGPVVDEPLMTVAQHERIVKAWIERWKAYIELSAKIAAQRDAANARLHEVATACATAEQERDAALARVAELERKLRDEENAHTTTIEQRDNAEHWADQLAKAIAERFGVDIGEHSNLNCPWNEALVWMQQPPAQAQHSVPEEFSFEYRHPNGECHTVTVSREQVINEMPDFLFEALCSKFCNCEPVGETNVVECCCDEYAEEFKLIAAAPGKEGV